MSRSGQVRRRSELGCWAFLVALLALAAGVWAFATPLFTGPDEVSQARRAVAVVRGEFTGRQERPGPPLLLTVDVPPMYGEPAEQNFLCHVGPLLDGAPQDAMALPSPPCPDLASEATAGGPATVEAETVQYRGQPFFYALVGLPTLLDEHVAGARAMRMVGVVATAALLASAFRTVATSQRRRLATVGLLACVTPGVLYLAGSTNPSAVEIAAALSAWTAVAVLATADEATLDGPLTGRLVRRLGSALVVLALCRGLGPAFAVAVLAIGTVAAGPGRARVLAARRDVRVWGTALAAAIAVSGAWLAHIAREFPLPDRAGSGFATALGWLPWYLHQSVGVFGTNDSGVSPVAAGVWCAVVVLVIAVGVVLLTRDRTDHPLPSGATTTAGPDRTRVRMAVLSVVALAGGLMMNVTAEGLSLPPIGFFWQGRYALPLLLGGIVLATVSAPPAGASDLSDPKADRTPRISWSGEQQLATVGAVFAAAILIVVHLHGLWVVTAHHGSPAGSGRWVAAVLYAIALAGLVAISLVPAPPSPPEDGDRRPGGSAARA